MSIAEDARDLYDRQLKTDLESSHRNRFVAIEPVSGSYYLGDKFIDAALAAKSAHPERTSFVVRIGHDAAFHIGGVTT